MTNPQLTVFFDGACPICSREIAHYRRRDSEGRLRLVDIAAPSFDAAAEGVDGEQVKRSLHVRRRDGQLITGLDSFIAIWDALGLHTAARLARLPGVNLLLRAGYRVFAAVRPYLPRRRDAGCSDDRCAVARS
ncbi:MAG: DUF393 domain-containing protein [Polyangia bacterium]